MLFRSPRLLSSSPIRRLSPPSPAPAAREGEKRRCGGEGVLGGGSSGGACPRSRIGRRRGEASAARPQSGLGRRSLSRGERWPRSGLSRRWGAATAPAGAPLVATLAASCRAMVDGRGSRRRHRPCRRERR